MNFQYPTTQQTQQEQQHQVHAYNTTNQPYPLYPPSTNSNIISPGQIGFNVNQAMSYPNPNQNPGYPQQGYQAPGYPTTSPYPPSTSAYPPTTSPYPPSIPSYPPTGNSFTTDYSGTASSYATQGASYPAQTGGYPSQAGGYPSQAGGYPAQAGHGYPTQQPSYAPQHPSYPPRSGYPSQPSSTYPTQTQHQPSFPSYPQGAGYAGQSHMGAVPPMGHHQQGPVTTDTPTVRPVVPFNARQDAEILRKAMKGFGTDEKAIINVLTKRSNAQRLEIATQFKSLYGKDLISDLKSEISGKFEQLIVAMMTPIAVFLASEIQHAISGIGTNEATLVEILCTSNNGQIYAIKNAYQQCFYRSLESDLKSDTSGNFRRLLVSLVQGARSENQFVDEAAARQDAQALFSAGELRLGTDESTFNAILVTRSYAQLRRIFMEYQRISGRTFESAIRSEFSGDIEAGLLAIVKCVENKASFFAECLRNAIAGMGTNDRALIRVVVSRSEIDLGDIKRAYQSNYGKSLESAISDDVSGDYKKTLLGLLSG